ncbi:acyltransferase family protein [Neobacillus sp. WH10]|uniref:acyltransferase family protein n=1 Tax=Neobacillus sp. WH10 TaxID=3047873 RepID=UPI0024C19991|nr:acyltransferase family protein [Neobacillus sp. WH10]WHY78354.1 acyltransferase family protein [Neobacillus sp. WH10]
MTTNPKVQNRRYLEGLDGLRGLAVLSVIFYHIGFPWASGGFLGVVVFFVLSGYLITDIIMTEWEQRRRINLKNFWIRRARRLLPAMLTMLVIIIGWVSLFHHHLLEKLQADALAALLYISNWWYIFHHQSYFDSFQSPSLLTHFWSLAVEEQFYLFWPLLLAFGLRFISKRSILFITLTLIGISALTMAILYEPGSDPSRVYYGTDTRAFSLLIGSALALIWPSQKLAAKVPLALRLVLNLIGTIALVVILLMVGLTNQYDPFLYRGGMVLLSIASMLLVAVLVHPANSISRVFNFKPLRWIGIRSYGIYLWQYPVLILTSPAINTTGISIGRVIFQLTCIIVLASLSWKFIENPIRLYGLKETWRRIATKKSFHNRFIIRRWIVLGGGVLIILVSFIAIHNVTIAKTDKKEETHAAIKEDRSNNQLEIEQKKKEPPSPDVHSKKEELTKPDGENKLPQTEPSSEKNETVTAIGDSILLDVAPYLTEYFPSLNADGKVGRQMSQALDVVKRMKQEGTLGDTVIIELGTNGPFTENQLISMIELIGNNRKIIFINTRVPRPWETEVNNTLKEVTEKFDNTTLVNWYAASAGHNEYFSPDGVHLNEKGAKAYAELVAKSVGK